jgi:acyl carrier protein
MSVELQCAVGSHRSARRWAAASLTSFGLTTMKSCLLIALLLIAAGCSPNQPSSAPVMNPELHSVIQNIAAEHLHKPVEALIPDATFASFGADDLDLVEITMAVEERLGITISDGELTKAAGTHPDQNLAAHLTLRAFEAVASAAPKQSGLSRSTAVKAGDGTLREAQVGVYGELSKAPNPNGYELVFVPSLELLVAQSEQKLERQMSQSERDALKQRAAVMALPSAVAEEFKRKRAEREATSTR